MQSEVKIVSVIWVSITVVLVYWLIRLHPYTNFGLIFIADLTMFILAGGAAIATKDLWSQMMRRVQKDHNEICKKLKGE